MLRFLVLLRAMRHNIALLLYAMLQRDTPRVVKFLFPLSLLYLISPVDIIPDTIPLVGAVDDMVILPSACCPRIRARRASGAWSVTVHGCSSAHPF